MNETMEIYKKDLQNGMALRPMENRDAKQLEALQYLVFPNLAEEEHFHASQYKRHVEIFPEGQYVITDADKIIAATSTMRYQRNENDTSHHNFFEVISGGWLSAHNPNGNWLYGLDVSVDPAYRGLGLAKELYKARHYTCKKLGLCGQITVGMLNGFIGYKNQMSIEVYFEKVKAGEIFDPTVSIQQKVGFTITRLMKEYLNDPTCGNAGAELILPIEKEI